ncbi:hypothetical protein QRD40_10850 [Comamonas sp. Y6]|uniref:Uncharacterized protein n=1 Tax=Comamonas resistens TaxID=3046670 RepID=A0ABY8SVV1_9BURK|nr:hypothetical protein [Comamonas resistens]MDL5036844.1 hypothetical protein [Comamonas resistens]WHS67154.1 hypothetical protein QMY55_08565 [Comamonas resistens]
MANFYADMADMARGLLAPTSQGGLGQGVIVLTRKTPGVPGPNPWDPVETVTQSETLSGAVRGVSQKLVGTDFGGTVVQASDRQAICAVPALQYQAGDVLSIDGVPVHIIAFSNIPPAGTPSAVRFIIKG